MASVKCGVTAQAVIHHYHRSETGITIINVKCGVTAQAVIHHYHRSETGITIINVKLRWTCSALNLNTVGGWFLVLLFVWFIS